MTNLQKITLARSETRAKLATLAAVEELSDEQRTEITKLNSSLPDLEVRFQAATLAETAETETKPKAPDGESRELAQLVKRANVGGILAAAVEHRAATGAERELQEHVGLADNLIPLALLRGPETRAVTPAPSDVGASQQPVIPSVFPNSVAAFLQVAQPTVGVGEAVYTTVTTDARVDGPHTGSTDVPDTTGSFSASVLSPARIQAEFKYRRSDRAKFAGMDGALRQNLADALADKLDLEVVNGTGAGLLNGTNLANHNVTAVTTYALYRSQLAYGRVDGKYAGDVGELRIVMGAGTYGHAAAAFRSNNAGDRAALEDLQAATAGVRVSAHVPAVSGANKQNCVIRLGSRMDMVQPVWEGVEIIVDPYSASGTGEIVLTAVLLASTALLRAAGFYKQQVQIA